MLAQQSTHTTTRNGHEFTHAVRAYLFDLSFRATPRERMQLRESHEPLQRFPQPYRVREFSRSCCPRAAVPKVALPACESRRLYTKTILGNILVWTRAISMWGLLKRIQLFLSQQNNFHGHRRENLINGLFRSVTPIICCRCKH